MCRGTQTRGVGEVVDDEPVQGGVVDDEPRDEPRDVSRHPDARLLTVDFGTPSYKFTVNICTYLIF
jgi:hypothetical protein